MLIRIRSLVDYDKIYYTLDGTDPTEKSIEYTGVFPVYESCTIKAISVKENWIDSPIAEYVVDIEAPTPVIGVIQGDTSDVCYVYLINSEEFEHNKNVRVHYTTDGSTPDINSPYFDPKSKIEISGNCTLTVSVSAENTKLSTPVSLTIEDLKAQTPEISVRFGENNERFVTITTNTSGAKIFYTLDGQDPSVTSSLYDGEFEVTEDCRIKAVAHKNNLITSDIAVKAVTTVPDTPVLQLVTGLYSDQGRVLVANISDYDKKNISFVYTLDDTEPSETSAVFPVEEGLLINQNCIVKVKAVSPYGLLSETGVLDVVTLRVQEVKVVIYTTEEYIILRSDTEGAEIYYTLNGAEPDRSGIKYTKPFLVQDGTEIRAIAYAEGLHSSYITSYIFNSEHVVDKPDVVIEHYEDNTYKVIVTSPEPVDSIHYTTDGSVPTQDSPVYDPENPPVISDLPCVLKFVSFKEGKEPSGVVTVEMGFSSTPIVTFNNYYILIRENVPLIYKEIEVEYE